MTAPEVEVPVSLSSGGRPPRYASRDSAGADLTAALAEPLRVEPGGRALVPTGLRVAVPAGYEAQVRPRSGLALRSGITVLNSPGTIDADYRGEVKIIIINHSTEAFLVEPGDRIAQMVICPVTRARFVEMTSLDESARGEGGFGSTGV